MMVASDSHDPGETQGRPPSAAEVVIVSTGDADTYRLVGDPEELPETAADRLAHAIAEARDAITEPRRIAGYENEGLSTGRNSLWWPDRTAQVVQVTSRGPAAVGELLTARIGQTHGRLRILDVVMRSPRQFSAEARLRVRGTGWRSVTLTVYPTPSSNLTVIEMMPRRAWMPQTKRYLAAGVPAITAFREDLETDSDDSPRYPSDRPQ